VLIYKSYVLSCNRVILLVAKSHICDKGFQEILDSSVRFYRVYNLYLWYLSMEGESVYNRTYPSTILFPFLFSLYSYLFILTK
jgi:hypothetical protein